MSMWNLARSRRRWSDRDFYFGPLTFAYDRKYRPISVVLSSGSEDRESPGCHIRFQAFGATMICELPAIIKPQRRWVDLSGRAWANNGGYWDEHPREYGFSLSEGHLDVKLGAQTHDSSTEQRWGCFLPWTQWRQISNRIYNADGSVAGDVASMPWDERQKIMDAITRVSFRIADYDGQEIGVETYIEDRTWRLGTGWFKWLGFIVPKKYRRSLDMRFDAEVGREKGSWKGGMIGTGIEMREGETHEEAFRRFCDQDHRSKSGPFRVTFLPQQAQQAQP